jgi:hypothetical protein
MPRSTPAIGNGGRKERGSGGEWQVVLRSRALYRVGWRIGGAWGGLVGQGRGSVVVGGRGGRGEGQEVEVKMQGREWGREARWGRRGG